MKITQAILDDLTAKAKVSPRLRMNLDLRDTDEDTSQRMLNAIEPGSPFRKLLYVYGVDWWKSSMMTWREFVLNV